MQQQKETRRQNMEQERGRIAWKNVQSIVTKQYKTLQKEYRSLARGLNAMIQINGLGQTLGFLKAKGKSDKDKEHYVLLQDLTDWMKDEQHFSSANGDVMQYTHDGLLKWVVDAGTSSADYRRATAECLAFGNWLRRFAEAELEGDES